MFVGWSLYFLRNYPFSASYKKNRNAHNRIRIDGKTYKKRAETKCLNTCVAKGEEDRASVQVVCRRWAKPTALERADDDGPKFIVHVQKKTSRSTDVEQI
jgi:hypothetical protein